MLWQYCAQVSSSIIGFTSRVKEWMMAVEVATYVCGLVSGRSEKFSEIELSSRGVVDIVDGE